jgi:hypothetical protein
MLCLALFRPVSDALTMLNAFPMTADRVAPTSTLGQAAAPALLSVLAVRFLVVITTQGAGAT